METDSRNNNIAYKNKKQFSQDIFVKNKQLHKKRFYLFIFLILIPLILIFQPVINALQEGSQEKLADYFPLRIIILSLCLLSASAFFSATETAFFALRATQLKAMQKSPYFRERLIAQLMNSPSDLLTSILMGNAIVNIGLSIAFGSRLEEYLSNHFFNESAFSPLSYLISAFVSTFILIIGGEITPKLLASRYVETYARSVVFLVYIIHTLFSPVRKFLLSSIGFTFRITRFSSIPPSPWVTDDELKLLMEEEELSHVIAEDERKIIRGILEFRDEPVKRILVPRTEIVAIPDDATVADAWDIFCEHEYSRMPIYHENLDHIVGILYAKDLLDYIEKKLLKQTVKPIGRKAYFVPETMVISEFIKTAQRLNSHLAIVVDEYGGTTGLVTLHDALSVIVGEISDDETEEEVLYEKIGPNEYLLDGRMPIPELEELIHFSLDDPEHTTIAGYLLKQHESLAKPGDVVEVGPLQFIIEEIEGKRIAKVRLRIKEPDENEEAGEDGGEE